MTKLRRLDGSALVATLLWMSLIAAFFAIIVNFTSLTFTQSRREVRAAQAINLGNGGLNLAIANYRAWGDYRGGSYERVTGVVDTFVTIGDTNVIITAQSYVPDKTTPRSVCRAFRVEIRRDDTTVIPDTYSETGGCDSTLTPPPVNTPPNLVIIEPDGSGDTYPRGSTVAPVVTLHDPDSVVTASLFYDTNNTGFDGTAIAGTCAVVGEGDNQTCAWNTTGIATGTYFIYGVVSDGVNPVVRAYSSGPFTITNASPTLTIVEPDGVGDTVVKGQTYSIVYSAADDDASGVAFALDTDASGFDGSPISECGTAPITTTGTCTFSTAALAYGSYYIAGRINDGVNSPVGAYSTGPLTVVAPPPTLVIHEPNGAGDSVYVGDTYGVTYSYSDSGANAAVAFFRDTNASGADGVALGGPCAASATGTNVSCPWTTAGVPAGSYYIYGVTTNALGQSVTAYSSGPITLLPAILPPQISVLSPPSAGATVSVGATYTVQFTFTNPSAGQVNASAYFAFSSTNPGAGTPMGAGTCQSPQSPGAGTLTCTWNTTGVSPGSYWIKATAKNGVTADVVAYSPGRLTIVGTPPNQAPTLTISEPNGVNDTVYKNPTIVFPVTVTAADPDNPTITVSLYSDTNATGFDGTPLPANCQTVSLGTNVSCQATMPDTLAYGDYYVYGIVSDGVNPPTQVYSQGPFKYANQPPALAIGTPSVDTVVAYRDVATIVYTASDLENAGVTGGFYLDTDNIGFDGLAIGGQCASPVLGTNRSCQFSALTPGTYYVWGVVNDGVNPDVKTYSAGRFIIQSPPTPVVQFIAPAAPRTIYWHTPVALTVTLGPVDYFDHTVSIFVDTDAVGYNGTAIIGCANLAKVNGVYDCRWDIKNYNLPPNQNVYVYAVATSPSYATAQTYSPRLTVAAECNDLRDNDFNGITDFSGGDPGCSSATDTTEGYVGKVSIDHVAAIVRDAAGNTYAVGSRQYNRNDTDMIIRKTLPSGAVDTTFGTNGFVIYHGGDIQETLPTGGYAINGNAQANAVAIGPDNMLYVVGKARLPTAGTNQATQREGWFIRKYSLGGVLDTTFGYPGNSTASWQGGPGWVFATAGRDEGATGIAFDSAGNIVVVGEIAGLGDYHQNRQMAIRKYTPQGRLFDGVQASPAWGNAATPGLVRYGDFVNYTYVTKAVVVKPSTNETFVTGGAYPRASLPDIGMVTLKLTASGPLDGAFGTGGVLTYKHPKTNPPEGSRFLQEHGISLATRGNDLYVGIYAAYEYPENGVSQPYTRGFVRKYRTTDGQLFNGNGGTTVWGQVSSPGMVSVWNQMGGTGEPPTALFVDPNNRLHVAGARGYFRLSANGASVANGFGWDSVKPSGLVSESVRWMAPKIASPITSTDFVFAGDWTGIVPGSPPGTPSSLNWETITTINNNLSSRAHYDSNVHN